MKLSTEAAVFKRVSSLIGGASMSFGGARPSLGAGVNEFPARFKLSKYTLRIPVSLPTSSAPVERDSSSSWLIMRPQRARFSSVMLEILVYLKRNFLEK